MIFSKKKTKKILLITSLVTLTIYISWKTGVLRVFAEVVGLSPDSGVPSRLNAAYDWLVAKGSNYGATDAGDWSEDWGTKWNRIMESAAWEPDGTATVDDVLLGKTFYAGNGDRTIKTGTMTTVGLDYSQQSLEYLWDSNAADNTTEESTWTNTATGVWQDERTGLYWSGTQAAATNLFSGTHANCDFFSASPRGSYGTAGTDPDCGNAINGCAVLSLESVTDGGADEDWYLPTIKEYSQAYIDGMYNQTTTAFTSTVDQWSSTESISGDEYAYYAIMNTGSMGGNNLGTGTLKSLSEKYRCVRRD